MLPIAINFFFLITRIKTHKTHCFRETHQIVYNKSTTLFGPSWAIIMTPDNRSQCAETCRRLTIDNQGFIDEQCIFFYVLLTVHLSIILLINQLNAYILVL